MAIVVGLPMVVNLIAAGLAGAAILLTILHQGLLTLSGHLDGMLKIFWLTPTRIASALSSSLHTSS
jgi:hypothetical protein